MKALLIVVIALSAFVTGLSQGVAGSGVTPEMRAEANKYYTASDWTNDVAAYEKIVKLEPVNPNANYRLGLSFLNLNKTTEAQAHLEKAMTASPNPIFALWPCPCVCACRQQSQKHLKRWKKVLKPAVSRRKL
ncbi:MAG: hypothetical protein IPK98_17350 [Chloracidobacterium sp.]|nr:hypothetical protein [Chloracidobacterium sp.]